MIRRDKMLRVERCSITNERLWLMPTYELMSHYILFGSVIDKKHIAWYSEKGYFIARLRGDFDYNEIESCNIKSMVEHAGVWE